MKIIDATLLLLCLIYHQVRSNMVNTLGDVKILTVDIGRETTSALTSVVAEPNEINIDTQVRP